MRIAENCHLTYCTNIHPGEDWPSLFTALAQHVPSVKAGFCPSQPMGLGLRLSAVAANTLSTDAAACQAFQQWLERQQLYVFTLNGFPYGNFHGAPVKDAVYRPDWSMPERAQYTRQLAEVLAALLPVGVSGSISTVPVGFKADLSSHSKLGQAAGQLLALVEFLAQLEQRTGRYVCLALEPEPGCLLETTAGTIDFFRRWLYAEVLPNGDTPAVSLATRQRYLGVCLDTCHAAVMYESSPDAARQFIDAGIPIHKIQLTAALQVDVLTQATRAQLAAFAEGVYLHQTCVSNGQERRFFLDLPDALAATPDGSTLRSHFHVPVFYQAVDGLGTTQADLQALLAAHKQQAISRHLEVETYTFGVLPGALNRQCVEANICRELNWVAECLR